MKLNGFCIEHNLPRRNGTSGRKVMRKRVQAIKATLYFLSIIRREMCTVHRCALRIAQPDVKIVTSSRSQDLIDPTGSYAICYARQASGLHSQRKATHTRTHTHTHTHTKSVFSGSSNSDTPFLGHFVLFSDIISFWNQIFSGEIRFPVCF